MTTLPLPPHFDPGRVGTVYRVPYQERAAEARAWARQHALAPAAQDSRRGGLLLVDVQNTFCLPEFELFVAGRSGRGAVEDAQRIGRFLYANLGRISQVVATLDTHGAAQIFHPLFWVDALGEHPAPNTQLSVEDVESGRWRVNPDLAGRLQLPEGLDLHAYARHYVRSLAQAGKYALTVWPDHSMLGGVGHALVAAVEEAVFFHSVARRAPARFEVKGSGALTEHYSVLRPEVMADAEGRPVGARNAGLVEALLGFDALIVAGEAKSHCVAWTVEDLLGEAERRDPSLAGRLVLLEDCTSPVVVPGVVDFTDEADAAYARFAGRGARRAMSTDPIGGGRP
jgi:nicotinamidase-related amidase